MLSRQSVTLIRAVGARGYRKHLVPTLNEMLKRQKRSGTILPQRNAFIEWDFSRELAALSRRFRLEPIDQRMLQDSFVSKSYVALEERRRKELNLPETEGSELVANVEMAIEGFTKLKGELEVLLRECYPRLPQHGLEAVRDYLCSEDTLIDIAGQMGLQPFVLREGDGLAELDPELLRDAFLALFTSLRNQSDFCRRFVLIQLSGLDLLDVWNPKDVTSLLIEYMKETGLPGPFEARIIGETGRNTLESVFYVGVYAAEKTPGQPRELLGKAAGSTQAQAVDAAIRDALRKAYRISRSERTPFERMALQSLLAKMSLNQPGSSNKQIA